MEQKMQLESKESAMRGRSEVELTNSLDSNSARERMSEIAEHGRPKWWLEAQRYGDRDMDGNKMIPEDIRKAAEEALDKLLCNDTESCGGTDGLRKSAISDIAEAILAERKRLTSVLEPFRSGGDWGTVKAYIINGAPTPSIGVGVAKTITQWQVAVDAALAGEA